MAAPDRVVPSETSDITSPASHGFDITPHDSNDLAALPRALWIGVGGDVTVEMRDANGAAANLLFKNVPSGTLLPIRPHKVLSTGTGATYIRAIW
jgi:hypothetical protein